MRNDDRSCSLTLPNVVVVLQWGGVGDTRTGERENDDVCRQEGEWERKRETGESKCSWMTSGYVMFDCRRDVIQSELGLNESII